MKLLARVNKTKVDPELMGRAMESFGDLSREERDFEGCTIQIVKLVAALDLAERDRMDLVLAINFRLTALCRLLDAGGGRGWTAPGSDGCSYIHGELMQCAAEEPLIDVDGELSFNLESFHNRLLGLAEAHGHA